MSPRFAMMDYMTHTTMVEPPAVSVVHEFEPGAIIRWRDTGRGDSFPARFDGRWIIARLAVAPDFTGAQVGYYELIPADDIAKMWLLTWSHPTGGPYAGARIRVPECDAFYEVDEDPTRWYVIRCLDCDEASGHEVDMPFSSPAERGRWATGHTKGTGHDRWLVVDI